MKTKKMAAGGPVMPMTGKPMPPVMGGVGGAQAPAGIASPIPVAEVLMVPSGPAARPSGPGMRMAKGGAVKGYAKGGRVKKCKVY